MGERRSDDDGGRTGRRRVHPGSTPAARSGPGPAPGGGAAVDDAGLEALLAAALIREGVDAGAEQRAVAAFLAARDTGAHGGRTRRRDDWRARRRRLGGVPLKTTLSVLAAGFTLSGVAVAGIGATDPSPDRPARDTGNTHASPGATTPPAPGSAAPNAGSGRAETGRPASSRDTEAECRTLGRAGERGGAPASAAGKRLAEAAGGPARVEAYCAELLETARREAERPAQDTARQSGSPASPGRQGTGRPGGTGNGSSGDAGREANGGQGGAPGGGQGNGSGGGAGGPAEPGTGNP
ncbi:hypothetical protein [Streptomyces pilosus]|uniref:Uncharacterized protein n=1 Tax=Streptomyces pilosus TaxID=28893 RepID=A0A918EY12_9ACTN|nr:hypothetical protein [Streptomyces pilosus]GGQ80744.1 hypothetical protein GCM10010280_29160 [Streptomyces pilosus]